MAGVAFSILALFVLASVPAHAAAPAFSMAPYKLACSEQSRIYASCYDQRKILKAGLAAAKAQHKRALVILGFNDCPPCNVLDEWMQTPQAQALIAPYVPIEISIFDPSRELRPEVFSQIIPSLKLPIADKPPYGVPDFSVVDPATGEVEGKPIIGFDADDPSDEIAYLKAFAHE